jgi:hypothetical protein
MVRLQDLTKLMMSTETDVKSVDEEIKSFRKIMNESMLSDPRRACVRTMGILGVHACA